MFELSTYAITAVAFFLCYFPFYYFLKNYGGTVVFSSFALFWILTGLILSQFQAIQWEYLLIFTWFVTLISLIKYLWKKEKVLKKPHSKSLFIWSLIILLILLVNSILDYPFAFDRWIHFSRALSIIANSQISDFYPGTDYYEFYFQWPHILIAIILSIARSIFSFWTFNVIEKDTLEFLMYAFNALWSIILGVLLVQFIELLRTYDKWRYQIAAYLSIPFMLYWFLFAGSIGVTITMLLFPGCLILFHTLIHEKDGKAYCFIGIITILALLTHPSFIALMWLSYIFFFFIYILRKEIVPTLRLEINAKLVLTGIMSLAIIWLLYFNLNRNFLYGFFAELERKSNVDMAEFISKAKMNIPPSTKAYFFENITILSSNFLWLGVIMLGVLFVINKILKSPNDRSILWALGWLLAIWTMLTFKIVPPLKPFEYTYWILIFGFIFLKDMLRGGKFIRFITVMVSSTIGITSVIDYWLSKDYIHKQDYLDIQSISNYIDSQDSTQNTLIMWIWPLSYTLNALTQNGKVYFWEYRYPDIPLYNELSFFFEAGELVEKEQLAKNYNLKYFVLPNKTYQKIFEKHSDTFSKNVTQGNFTVLEYANIWNQ